MAQTEPRATEKLVVLDGKWFRDETIDALRTFVAPIVAVVRAIEQVSRPRDLPSDRAAPGDGGADRAA